MTGLRGRHRWKMPQLVNESVLKVFAGLIGRGTDTSCEIDAPSVKTDISMLRPTECHEIKPQRIGDGGIIFGAASISRGESVGRKPCGER